MADNEQKNDKSYIAIRHWPLYLCILLVVVVVIVLLSVLKIRNDTLNNLNTEIQNAKTAADNKVEELENKVVLLSNEINSITEKSSSEISNLKHDLENNQKLLKENELARATYSLYVFSVPGWNMDSESWTQGAKEKSAVGEIGVRPTEGKARAICMGIEGDSYVFVTLRSFVDPFYPNMYVQGLNSEPVGRENKKISFRELADDALNLNIKATPLPEQDKTKDDIPRYLIIGLAWYKDIGAGSCEVIGKEDDLVVTTDKNDPPPPEWLSNDDYYNGEKYHKPCNNVSVEEHFCWRNNWDSGKTAKLVISSSNDLALIFVPRACLETNKDNLPPNLGLEEPSIAVGLLMEYQTALMGFEFSLIGKETLEKVAQYKPNYKASGMNGVSVQAFTLDTSFCALLSVVCDTVTDFIPAIKGMKIGKAILGAAIGTLANNNDFVREVRKRILQIFQ